MRRLFLILLLAAITPFALSLQAQATGIDPNAINLGIPLSELIEKEGSIDQADKHFSDFFFDILVQEGQTGPSDASGILVKGMDDGDGNHGLQFTSNFLGQDVMFAGPGSSLKLIIGYKVTVTDPSLLASDLHLNMISFTSPNSGASITVTETAKDGGGNVLGTAQVTNPPQFFNSDVVDLDPAVSMFSVEKVIELTGGTLAGCESDTSDGATRGCGFAAIVTIGQFVSQERNPDVIPEPATLLLLGSGLFGLMARGRGRLSKNL